MKVTIPVEIDENEIMECVLEGIFRSSSPWVIEYTWADDEETAEVKYQDENYDTKTKTVSKFTFINAYRKLLADEKYHCGERVPSRLDLWDSCVSDYVLQYACFGELIYG